MSKDRKSFLLHIDSLDILEDLTIEESGQLFNAIRLYQLGEEMPLKGVVKIAFSPFRNQFIRDIEKYQLTCKRRAEAGSKGGKQKVANVANASKCKQEVANVADSDSKNKSKSKSDSDSKNFKPLVANAPVDQVTESMFEDFWLAGMAKVGGKAKTLAAINAKLKANNKSVGKIRMTLTQETAKRRAIGKTDAQSFINFLVNDIKQRLAANQYGFDRLHPVRYITNERYNDEITTPVNPSPESMNTDTDWAKGLLS